MPTVSDGPQAEVNETLPRSSPGRATTIIVFIVVISAILIYLIWLAHRAGYISQMTNRFKELTSRSSIKSIAQRAQSHGDHKQLLHSSTSDRLIGLYREDAFYMYHYMSHLMRPDEEKRAAAVLNRITSTNERIINIITPVTSDDGDGDDSHVMGSLSRYYSERNRILTKYYDTIYSRICPNGKCTSIMRLHSGTTYQSALSLDLTTKCKRKLHQHNSKLVKLVGRPNIINFANTYTDTLVDFAVPYLEGKYEDSILSLDTAKIAARNLSRSLTTHK